MGCLMNETVLRKALSLLCPNCETSGRTISFGAGMGPVPPGSKCGHAVSLAELVHSGYVWSQSCIQPSRCIGPSAEIGKGQLSEP